MDVKAALEWADELIHAKTGKYLNDLERKVFVGSWQNLTYRKIDLDRAEYLEKYVGFHLWHKLSTALGEKVTKKNFRGALERSLKQPSGNHSGYPEGVYLTPVTTARLESSDAVL